MVYTQVHSHRNISHSLGRKNKTQSVILPFLYKFEELTWSVMGKNVFLHSQGQAVGSTSLAQPWKQKENQGDASLSLPLP